MESQNPTSQTLQHTQQQNNSSPQTLNTFIYEPPTQQQYQYKIYINQVDQYIGSQLVQQFRNDHLIEANPNIIVGSISVDEGQQYPSGVTSIINTLNQRLYNSVLLSSDIILFSLNDKNIQQFQYILKLLKNATLQKQIRVICISSLLSWGKRRSGNYPIKVKKEQLFHRNSLDYHLKSLEDLCLALHTLNPKVHGSTVFSGLLYGLGEDILFKYFKRALEQEKPLQIYGKGSNIIPTIHLKDLTQIIYNISFQKFDEKKNWHFALDSSKITQKQLIQSIANNLGNGSTVEKSIEDCFMDQNFNQMTLDIEILDGHQKLEEWHCPQSFIKCIQTIVSEFNQYRGLRPNKIVIIGIPVGGKSSAAQNLRKQYGLPVITIKSLIADLNNDTTQFSTQIKSFLQQLRKQKVQQQRKAYQQMKKKKKGKGVEQFQPEKVIARLPDEQLGKVLKWRLNFSDCLNKGYILDSVIKTFNVAKLVFEENDQLNKAILPNSVFMVNGSEDQVKSRVKWLSAQQVKQNPHWTQDHSIRRYANYLKDNEQQHVRSYFQGKVDVQGIGFGDGKKPEILTAFIERNGPLGFKVQKQIDNLANGQKDGTNQNKLQQGLQNNGQEQEQQRDEQEEIEEQFNLQKLTAKEQKILNERSRPIRQYLIDNVIPQITQGLLQICKSVPQDPIDFLITFLEKKNVKKSQ